MSEVPKYLQLPTLSLPVYIFPVGAGDFVDWFHCIADIIFMEPTMPALIPEATERKRDLSAI